jgi:hypothetical protein
MVECSPKTMQRVESFAVDAGALLFYRFHGMSSKSNQSIEK